MTTDQLRLGQGASLFNPIALPGKRLLTQTQPTIFVDRDGVINQNRANHVLAWKDFQFIDDSIKALALLHQAGYQIIVVTNQAAIARGLISVPELELIHHRMMEAIEAGGGKVKSILYCTHLPNAGCACRKPKPGLLLQAAQTFNVDLPNTWMIGDHNTDMQTALAAGCKPLLVLTGRGQATYKDWLLNQQPLHDTDVFYSTSSLTVKANLLEAVQFVLNNERVLV